MSEQRHDDVVYNLEPAPNSATARAIEAVASMPAMVGEYRNQRFSPSVDLLTEVIEGAELCRSTVAGWIWYCDAHDTHGNADSEDEAKFVAVAHEEYRGDECDLHVVPVR